MTEYILVTGGAGFIGGHIIEHLLELEPKTHILCVDCLNEYYDSKLKKMNLARFKNKIDFLKADILHPKTNIKIRNIIGKGRLLKIIHMAAQPGVRYSILHPREVLDINIIGTMNMLELAREFKVDCFVNASSSSVYGSSEKLPFREGASWGFDYSKESTSASPTLPISSYGVSKLAAEHYVRTYSELYQFRAVNLRFFTVFGPRVRPDLAINIFTHAALRNKPLKIFGTGKKTRDFTNIENIVNGIIKSMNKGHGVYNLGCGARSSILDLAKRIIRLTGSKSKIEFYSNAQGDMEHTLADVSKAKQELGYIGKVNLDVGLKRYIEWVRSLEGQRYAKL